MTAVDSDTAPGAELASVGLLEHLKEDQRPSCVMDLDYISNGECLPRIGFRNSRFTEDYNFEAPCNTPDSTTDERLYFHN